MLAVCEAAKKIKLRALVTESRPSAQSEGPLKPYALMWKRVEHTFPARGRLPRVVRVTLASLQIEASGQRGLKNSVKQAIPVSLALTVPMPNPFWRCVI